MATLIVPSNPSLVGDARALRNAFKGRGSDDKTILTILGHRNVHQRQQIREAYDVLYQEDLVKRLESEISDDFERALYRWMLEPADRDAVLLNVAIKNGSKDYHLVAEIASVLSSEELLAVRRAYHNRYGSSLEEDVAANTIGLLRQFRYPEDRMIMIDGNFEHTEANILHESVNGKKGKYEELIRIITTRSKLQLVATVKSYKYQHGISSRKTFLDETSDNFHKALHTALCCIGDHKRYYEKVLCNAINKFGTDEDGLDRVVVSRAEKDLRDIKELYYKRNNVHLEDAVSKEISGNYKKFILTLLGKED